MVIVVDNYIVNYTLPFVSMPLRSRCLAKYYSYIKNTERLAESSFYDLNPQSTPSRDGMDGLEATYCGVDFVLQKISGKRYSTETVDVNCFMSRGCLLQDRTF
ncbi:hypothetical protein AVEN_223478-1 [Araneus ventricosus]|uniref:Uncharacterized protein n=1 Tax=Araneus ventricosus TaxID=182803 RepID=A0A4Y2ETZ5_ARAVE|nr:hypothetical protein AVEN_223478-1 [Araneus ventricosus]